MNEKSHLPALQNASRNDLLAHADGSDSLAAWMEAYFRLEVTTLESSQSVQRRDLALFLTFMRQEVGSLERAQWTPRLSQAFKVALQKQLEEDGSRRWNDRTINRILAHLKTFTKWVHQHRAFPLGNPMSKVKAIATANLLDVERAITTTERRRLLDAADLLPQTGGRSRDRHRYRTATKRPRRKGYRPYRNRAIVYTLIETGMRRAAVARVHLADVDFTKRVIHVEEKGGVVQTYQISREGLDAIQDYLTHERATDTEHFDSPTLFLASRSRRNTDGRLSVRSINTIWNEVCAVAGVEGRTPHSARHAMGRHIIEKTGNVSAVQRQLGHKNPAYSLQYTRITAEEMDSVLNDRE